MCQAGKATLGAAKWAARVAELTRSLLPHTRLLLRQPFAFDRSGEPSRDLATLLWLLCVERVPKAKQVERLVDAAVEKERLGLPVARVLLGCAIDPQLEKYTYEDEGVARPSKKRRQKPPGGAKNGIGASSARLENIARLIQGERRIWQNVRFWAEGF